MATPGHGHPITRRGTLRPTFRKHERLVGHERIKKVARDGHSLQGHPFRLTGLFMELDTPGPAQVAFAVPKRRVAKAVDRNRIRRHMREAYRQNKHRWYGPLEQAGLQCAWLVIYQGHAPMRWEDSSRILIDLFDRWTRKHVGADQ